MCDVVVVGVVAVISYAGWIGAVCVLLWVCGLGFWYVFFLCCMMFGFVECELVCIILLWCGMVVAWVRGV